MANVKTGLLYYSSETDRFKSDLRIKRLKKGMGCDGYAVYEYILNEIYRVGGCFLVWDESTAFDVAEYWGLKETKVNEIVRYCCAVGLFDKALLSNGNVLTSSSIQSRYVEMCIRAKRKEIIIPEQFDILPEESRKMLEEYYKMHGKQRKMREESNIITEESPKIHEESRKMNEVCRKVIKVNKEISLERDKERQAIAEGMFTPDELGDMLSESSDWLRMQPLNIFRQTGMKVDESAVLSLISDYVCKLKAEGIGYKSLGDARIHFANWVIKFLKTQDNGNNRANYTSKQEANEYALGLLVRHGRELDEGMAGEVERPF